MSDLQTTFPTEKPTEISEATWEWFLSLLGTPDSYEEFYSELVAFVHTSLRLSPVETYLSAEDIAVEILLRVLKARERRARTHQTELEIKNISQLLRYCRVVSKHLLIDVWRKNVPHKTKSLDTSNKDEYSAIEQQSLQQPAVTDLYTSTYLLHELLKQLNESESHLLGLFYFEQMTTDEIANKLKTSPEVIRQRLHRIRVKLKNLVG